ncbi:flagellar motor switch protein FliG [Alicyclobacillus ferrooxydans]|uniref:Flagellar motor switch protein FliG n=1 Tax=Alicyclobacillus ferrooxydans TaxID=471514 RepID=A0A0P9EZ55_9BACL|nr:flagellar motor switch protein FliG [Alicyclobacillus ferrooxydans]KPV44378.1 flagellar motor switch protein FliG [Alicyclobacillus ferrooxydans]
MALQRRERPLTGREKAAIMMISLGQDTAAKVYQILSEEEMESLTYQIANLKRIDNDQREQVFQEFHDLATANEYIMIGGIQYARDVLEKAVGQERADRVFSKLQGSLQVKPFAFAKNIESSQILAFLQGEHPQTIALVLSYLDPNQSATIIQSLPHDIQVDIARRIALTKVTSPEAVYEIEQALEAKLSTADPRDDMKIGGIDAIVQIINGVDRATEKTILDSLITTDPELADEIKKKLFVFEDIAMLDSRALQRVIRDVETKDMQLALKGSSEEVKTLIFANMSKRMADTIQEEMEFMGAVRLQDVEDAQQSIVAVIRRLEDEGEIVIARGGENYVR